MRKRKQAMKFGFVMLLVLLSACGYTRILPTQQVRLDFFEADCMAACWKGLKPGVTTEKMTGSFFKTTFTKMDTFDSDGFDFFSGVADEYSVEAYARDGVLTGFMINTPLVFDVSFGQIVDTLGQPPYHLAFATRGEMDYAFAD